jgi:hypothetical protein
MMAARQRGAAKSAYIRDNLNRVLAEMTYADALKRVPHENIVVADITSSLNPLDDKNHVSQIEPSGLGGKKIAKMLRYVMISDQVASGRA